MLTKDPQTQCKITANVPLDLKQCLPKCWNFEVCTFLTITFFNSQLAKYNCLAKI